MPPVTHTCGSEAEYFGAINERPPDRLYWCRDCDIKFWEPPQQKCDD